MQGCRLLITFVSPHLFIVISTPVIPFTEDLHVPLKSNDHHKALVHLQRKSPIYILTYYSIKILSYNSVKL